VVRAGIFHKSVRCLTTHCGVYSVNVVYLRSADWLSHECWMTELFEPPSVQPTYVTGLNITRTTGGQTSHSKSRAEWRASTTDRGGLNKKVSCRHADKSESSSFVKLFVGLPWPCSFEGNMVAEHSYRFDGGLWSVYPIPLHRQITHSDYYLDFLA